MTGERVKALILEKGYSVAQVAEMIGTSQQNLAANLKHTDVRSGLLERVANALGLNVLEFYGEKAGDAPVLSANGNRNTQVTQVAGNYSSVSSDANVLELLKMKDEQLSLAMRQTSKAQEQMDRVLDFLGTLKSGPDKPYEVHILGSLKDREEEARASHCSDDFYSFVSPIPQGVPNRKTTK